MWHLVCETRICSKVHFYLHELHAARSFWLVDTPSPGEALEVAKRLYSEQCQVPYMARFLVYAKRTDPNEARLRCFCVTDDRLEKTLELQEKYIEVARSNPVEVRTHSHSLITRERRKSFFNY